MVTVQQQCVGSSTYNPNSFYDPNSPNWNIRLGPGRHTSTALYNMAPVGSKRNASYILITSYGYKVRVFQANDCSGSYLEITYRASCLPVGWNEQLGCLDILRI